MCTTRVISTTGDRTQDSGEPLPSIGGKGLFTAELERALRDGDIDVAVHSLKDLPTEDEPGVAIGAVTARDDVRDCLVARTAGSLAELPAGAVIGTSSLRRSAQLAAARPDLEIRSIRGNVDSQDLSFDTHWWRCIDSSRYDQDDQRKDASCERHHPFSSNRS